MTDATCVSHSIVQELNKVGHNTTQTFSFVSKRRKLGLQVRIVLLHQIVPDWMPAKSEVVRTLRKPKKVEEAEAKAQQEASRSSEKTSL